jgi:hypothetical protein
VRSPGPLIDVLGSDPNGGPVIQLVGRDATTSAGQPGVTTVDVGPPITGASVGVTVDTRCVAPFAVRVNGLGAIEGRPWGS